MFYQFWRISVSVCVKRTDLRVVIMSATINPDLFMSYFADWNPVVLEIAGRVFPVEVLYERSSHEDDYMAAAYRKAAEIHRQELPGDILVFLTSPLETEKACRNLLNDAAIDSSTVQVIFRESTFLVYFNKFICNLLKNVSQFVGRFVGYV